MLTWLLVSILCGTAALFWPLLVYNFAIIIGHMLFMVKEVLFTILMCLSAVVFCSFSWTTSLLTLVLLQTARKWISFLHLPHIFLYAGHCWVGWLDPQYLHFWVSSIAVLYFCLFGVFFIFMRFTVVLCDLTGCNSLFSLRLYNLVVTHWEFRFFSGFQVNWCHSRN